MERTIKKICLGLICAGFGAILLAPLLLDNSFFFPFTSTKVFIFRSAVEILLLLYLILNVVTEEYRPRLSWLTLILAAFIAAGAVSTLTGPNPSGSFWGDIERGEGLIMWLHLLAFFLVLTGVLRRHRAWATLLDGSIAVAVLMSLFGLAQIMNIASFLATSGDRVDATLGNPAFFAAYLLMHLGFAAYLFFYRKSRGARIYYVLVGTLFMLLIPATQTRGAVLGLLAALLLAALLFVYVSRENRRVRSAAIGVILAVIALSAGLYVLRNQSWVRSLPGMERVLSISLQERTAQTRLATWGAAWSGIKERPVFGWGMENFTVVFNKHFPPVIYEDAGSQVWFDRAHNVIFDRGVAGGIIGLVLFLSLLFYPLYYLLRHRLHDGEERGGAIILAALLVGYFIQDLFIFETVATYIILFLVLGSISSIYLPELSVRSALRPKFLWIAAAAVWAILLWPVLWNVNIYAAKMNIAAATALRSNAVEEDFFQIIERHKAYLDAKRYTYGLPEYRLEFIDFVGQQLAPVGEVVPRVVPVLEYTDRQLEKQLREQPQDAKNWLLAMRHYNYTHASMPEKKRERLEKALSVFETLQRLSPGRPPVYQEAGYTYHYLFRIARDEGKTEVMSGYLSAAEQNFKKALDLNPQVYESYVNLISLYLNSGQSDKITGLVQLMDDRGVDFRLPFRLRELSTFSKNNENYHWLAFWNEELTKVQPENPQAFIDWALAETYQGHRDKAIEIAQKIKAFGGNYVAEGDEFIARVQSGYFEDQVN